MKLCQSFHQDVVLIFPSVESAASTFVSDLGKEEAKELATFLTQEMKKEGAEIVRTWDSCASDLFFETEKLRDLYQYLLVRLQN